MIKQGIKEYRSLYEESWDLFGQLVLDQDVERVISVLENDESISQEADHFYHEFDTVNCNRIKHFIKKSRLRKWINQYIPHAVRMGIMTLGIMVLGVGIAAASNTSVRLYLARLIVDVTPEYTVLQIKNSEEAFSIPDEWTGKYYPSVIPEGLIIGKVYDGVNDHCVVFCKPDSSRVIFSFEEAVNSTVNIDTEDAYCQTVIVNGHSAESVTKNDHITIYWMEDERIMIIYVRDSSAEKAIEYANGVRRIQ